MDRIVKGGQGRSAEEVEESACFLVALVFVVLVAWFVWLAFSSS